MNRFLGIIIISIIIILVGFFYFRYYWVVGEGVKAGELNYVVKKGYLFKTYEGKLIQSGYRSKTPGSVQSNEFEFSIINSNIANQLMLSSGKEVNLHYVEYIGTVPWRGYTKYVVDSVLSIREIGR
jgi:hypothetical protein